MTPLSFYRAVDQGGRTAGASPHALVAILFEECLEGIAVLEAAYQRGRPAHAENARVHGILHALEASLDHRTGGETAALMARVYREARRCLTEGASRIDPLWCDRARATLEPVADAWTQIAQAA